MATDPIKLQLRLAPELHTKLVAARDVSGRSLNAEISHRLAASFDQWMAEGVREIALDLPRLHKVIGDLSDALAEERARRRREVMVVFKAFEAAVEEYGQLVEQLRDVVSDEIYNDANSDYGFHDGKLAEIAWYVEEDNPHLKDL